MADFIVNADVVIDEPTVEVTMSGAQSLPLGAHRFRLIVIDDMGNSSAPDEVEIIVADQDNPTALVSAPKTVTLGKPFVLDGGRAFDAGGGKVVQWTWTYLGRDVPVEPS